MREILFRAKDIDTKEWRFGQYIHLHKTTHCFKEDNDVDKDNDIHQIVFEEMTDWNLPNRRLRADIDVNTLGQFTGLTDKNGKKIFEGDILTKRNIYIEDGKPLYYVAKYWFCGFDICNVYGQLEMSQEVMNRLEVEVIGNIYDNPELLGD